MKQNGTSRDCVCQSVICISHAWTWKWRGVRSARRSLNFPAGSATHDSWRSSTFVQIHFPARLSQHLDSSRWARSPLGQEGQTDGCAGTAPSHVIFQGNEQHCSWFSCHSVATPGGELWHWTATKAFGKVAAGMTLWPSAGCLFQLLCGIGNGIVCIYQTSMNWLTNRFLCQLKKWSELFCSKWTTFIF